MAVLKPVTLELLRMLSGRAFHNLGPDFAKIPLALAVCLLSSSSFLSDIKHIDVLGGSLWAVTMYRIGIQQQ